MNRRVVMFLALAAALVPVKSALGQSPLDVSVSVNGSTSGVAAGGLATLTANGIGQPVTATVTVRYSGTGTASINSITSAGTTAITLAFTPVLPLTLNANTSTSFVIQYLPSNGSSITNLLSINFTENGQASIFSFNVRGVCPDLSFTFFVAPDGALNTLNSGDRISFPSTNVGSSAYAVINVLNRGSAPGSLQSVSVSGSDFQVSGATTPAAIPAGQQASFTLTFNPHNTGTSSGLLTVGLSNNTSASFLLSGLGASPTFVVSYRFADNNVHTFANGDTIAFPSVDVNANATATFDVINQGSGTGSVSSVSIAGTGFQLTGLPQLPANIAAGQTLRFGIIFNPTQPGTYSGSFRITVNGTSIAGLISGSTNPTNLVVSYALTDGNVHQLFDGGLINFPSADVNTNSTAAITIVNQGTGSGTVTGISIAGAGFQLSGLPLLPSTIAAGGTLRFNIVFNPTSTGSFSGSFRIDMSGRSVSGSLAGSTSAPNFSVSYTLADSIVRNLSDGTAIVYPPVDINATSSAVVTILNQGPGTGSVTGLFVAGTGFQLSGSPQLPASVPAGQSVRFNIVFTPAKSGTFSGTFRIDMTGRSISGTLNASTASATFTLSYIDPDTSNILPLAANGTLQFPNTLVGSTSAITVQAANTGAGTGTINAISLGSTTSAFQLLSLPPLPLSVGPSQQLRFGIRFNPQVQQTVGETLILDLNGQTITVNLQAQGTKALYTYAWASGTGTTTIPTDGTAAFGDTNVGQTSSVVLTISNGGTGDGQISTIGISGQGFTLSDLPAVPFILKPNGSQHFTVNFTPTQPGAVSGRLTIGSETVTVTGTGIGSRLTFAYNSASSSVPVTDTGVVIFAPQAVGTTGTTSFSIQNTGTSAATISSINLAVATTVFTLSQLPALPASLDPGATLTFAIGFVPNTTGSITATLRVNSTSFTLSGNGTAPAALSAYRFQGPSGNVQPAQQPAIGLTLASPYPSALQGTLKLTFVSSVFTDDPSVQFATGGRTVSFTIPANSTQAVFSSNTTTVPLQTGTTAGNIVITPSFAMTGGFDLTPASPDALTMVVPRSVPQLLSASISSQTLSSFTVVVNGYSTTRAVRQLDIQITPKAGQNFSATHLTVDVTSAASSWYQSATSQTFGGSFLIAIPFTLSNGSASDDLVRMLQSLSITATNDAGASTAVTVAIP